MRSGRQGQLGGLFASTFSCHALDCVRLKGLGCAQRYNSVEGAMSLFDLSGRVAIVTGGNRGIGFGMAKGLAEAGAAVTIAARDPGKSAAAADKLQKLGARVATVEVDVKD